LSIKEQIRRILAAAPKLGYATVTSALMIIPMFMGMKQFVETLLTTWIETSSYQKEIGNIYQRTADEKKEFVFDIIYHFKAGQESLTARKEKVYTSQTNANLGLEVN